MTTTEIVKRAFVEETLEIRTDPGKGHKIAGMAAVYDADSVDLGGFTEQIARGAFSDSLRSSKDVLAYFEHDHRQLLGRTSSGTLQLRDTNQGLHAVLSMPDTTLGRDVVEMVRRGDLTSWSFGMRVLDDSWDYRGGMAHRTVKSLDLDHVSPVAAPAYQATSLELSDARRRPAAVARQLAIRQAMLESQ